MSTKKPEKLKKEPPSAVPIFKAPNFFKVNKFGGNMKQGGGARFNPGTFKTQHKG